MKKIFCAFFIFTAINISAQNKITKIKLVPALTSDIEKVARDYYIHFDNIKGEKLSESGNIIEYASKISPPGAIESTIMQIKSLQNSYSWQALMLNTENYDEAVAGYKKIYRQLNGAKISLEDGESYKLSGEYDTPSVSRAFASSMLELNANKKAMQSFKIEIALNYSMPEWSVKIYVYEKENDADIRPTVNTGY
ncbi:MAG: hypothetical protein M3015_00075 [Bacteroidota bacterium]|nr:hypothetical protein [Bacteroidota bacterium]